MQRRILVIAVAALALLAVATPLTLRVLRAGSSAPAVAAPPPPSVTVALVEQRTLVESEELTGRVDAIESVDLRAEVGGRLAAVHFKAGQLVAAGDLLFTIDPRTYAAARDAARAAVARAEALAATTAKEAARAANLLAREAISAEEADLRQSRAAEAAAELLAARAALTAAEIDLERTEVRAPIAGRVSRELVTTGNLVSPATPLTTVVSTGRAYVYADVAEATVLKFRALDRAGRLQRDEQGRIPVELALADESEYSRFGYIESVDNRLDTATGTLQLRMLFDDPENALVPGLFARVRVPLGTPQPTLLISERAVGTDQSQKFVLAVDDAGVATYRTVRLGGLVDGKRVVRSGLQAGETIIVNGLQRVRPGMTVAAQLENGPPAPAPTGLAVARR
jgi:RND family efflux transporter, MFP subunit